MTVALESVCAVSTVGPSGVDPGPSAVPAMGLHVSRTGLVPSGNSALLHAVKRALSTGTYQIGILKFHESGSESVPKIYIHLNYHYAT